MSLFGYDDRYENNTGFAFRRVRQGDTYQYQYWCFGQWRPYFNLSVKTFETFRWSPHGSMERKIYTIKLSEAQKEMRFYQIERVD